jgi:hypothetical protein
MKFFSCGKFIPFLSGMTRVISPVQKKFKVNFPCALCQGINGD